MGRIDFDNQEEPPTPNSNKSVLYFDEVDKHIKTKDDDGVVIDLTETALTIRFTMINNTGVTIPKTSAVHFESYDDPNDEPEMVLADADDATKMPAVGINENEVLNGAVGFVTFIGALDGVDTSAFAEGDELFVGKTPGSLVNSRPTGGTTGIQIIATVGKINATTGTLAVHGSLRANSLPNLADGKFWLGDSSGFPVQTDGPNILTPNTVPFTGIITGGEVTVNAGDNTTFDVAAGTGRVVDYTDPLNLIVTPVSWDAFIAESVPDISGDNFTALFIDDTGALNKAGDVNLTPNQIRENVMLGAVTHPLGTIIENAISNPIPVYNTILGVMDYIRAAGGIVTGSAIAIPNANLTFKQEAGVFTNPFRNYAADKMATATIINDEADPKTFNYNHRDGVGGFTELADTTLIDPDQYDDGSGTLASVPNNNWTWQPVFFVGSVNRVAIGYSQFLYSSKSNAEDGIGQDFSDFIQDPTLANSDLLGFFVLKEGATDLTDTSEADFISVFGAAGGGTSGASTFDQLTDTPANKSGFEDNILKVDSAGTTIEYTTAAKGNSLGHAEPAITGVLTGGGLVINGTTQVDVTAGTGEIVNFYDNFLSPTITPVTWSGATITIPSLGVDNTTFIFIDNAGVIQTQSTDPTALDNRTKIFLGLTINNTGLSQVADVIESPQVIGNTSHAFLDQFDFTGGLTDGGSVSQTNDTGTNGTLAVRVESLDFFFPNINWQTSKTNPNVVNFAATDPTTWVYMLQTGEIESVSNTLIDPTLFDDGGVATAVPTTAGGTRATIQYLYKLVDGIVVVLYGQTVYNSLSDAFQALDLDQSILIVPPFLQELGVKLAAIGVIQAATDLAVPTDAFIEQTSTGAGGGGSGSTTYLGLIDTDNDYTGQDGKVPTVKSTEDGLEFTTLLTTLLELTDFPSTYAGQAGKVATVNGGETAIEFTTISSTAFPVKTYFSGDLDTPVNSDWTVSARANASADTNNNGLTVRRFDDTTEEGVSFNIDIPSTATNMKISFKSRAETAPGGAQTVAVNFYEREIPDNAAVTAWSSAVQLTDLDIPTNEFFQLDTETLTLAALGLTAGSTHQIEITRDTADAGDTLSGDWSLLFIKIEFT